MELLFFDIECANCFQGHGKICSFGYVICDEYFNIKEQKDILINPKSKFHLGKPGTDEGIKLAYDEAVFKKQPDFNWAYGIIKNLLENKNYILFGHSVGNDLQFIISECERYKKGQYYIKAYDTQVIYRQLRDLKNDTGLEKLCEEYNIEKEALHRSDYDALITMKVLKAMCKETNLDVHELLERYPESYLEAKDGAVVRRFNVTSPAKVVLNYSRKIYIDKSIAIKELFGQSIAIDNVFEEENIKRAKNIAKWIKRVGCNYTIKPKKCNYYVMENKDSKRSKIVTDLLEKQIAEIKIIDLEELERMLKIEERL